MVLIIANTLILATDRYPTPDQDLIQLTDRFFTFLFGLEVLLKLIGLTLREWKRDPFNVLDLLIILSSILELLISYNSTDIISALRSIRLLRVIKLARSNFTLRFLLDSIAYTISSIANFTIILGIFIYVFSLLGMEIFAGKFKFDDFGVYDPDHGTVPRQNYDHIIWSLITVFQILVGDQWNEVMYKAYNSSSRLSLVYFILLVLIGKIIMLNLFLAILLGYFEQASLTIRSQNEDLILQKFGSQVQEMQASSSELNRKPTFQQDDR